MTVKCIFFQDQKYDISRGFLQRQLCEIQLLIVNIYFFNKIFSYSTKNANIADCLKKTSENS